MLFRLTVPSFITSPFTGTFAIACLPYSGGLAGKSVAPTGDLLSYAKVSGPAWLNVATNGVLSGTPTNSDIGTNIFIVSLTDTNGVYATATMDIIVIADPAPSFVTNPFEEPWANLEEDYHGSIATNGTAPYLGAGDILSFARVSGPAWLVVAVDGTLSGIPDGTNAGTNTFVVSVTDLGGSSNTATLVIYVNSAPQFEPENFSGPPALVGVAYAASIATNAVDPDLGAGDGLTFYKVTGASWLNVATNGILSGSPGSGDLGAESFLILAVDSGGLAGIGNLTIMVNPNNAPVLLNNPFIGPSATAGQSYSAIMATNALDSNVGGQLVYTKVSGPAWLMVRADGSISGMPLSTNAGVNRFVVNVADQPGGLATNATLLVNVTAFPVTAALTKQGGNLLLNWSGGVPPYQVQVSSNPAGSGWQNLGAASNSTNLIVSPTNAGMFYRVQGQ
jgi:hypothetical protein